MLLKTSCTLKLYRKLSDREFHTVSAVNNNNNNNYDNVYGAVIMT